MPQILPLFPEKIYTFVDLFGGGFNVGINVEAEHIVYNDQITPLANLLAKLYEEPLDSALKEIDYYINKYSLSKENQEGYLKLREDYNEKPQSLMFYTLICYAFNYQIRFNSKGEYNMPFGKNRSSFNPTLRKRFIAFVENLKKKNIKFYAEDYLKFYEKIIPGLKEPFIYCDPPYFNSTASYNENSGWSEVNEEQLLSILDILDSKGIKFALSNNLKYDNPILKEWMKKYNVHYLISDYSNCNYQKKDKSEDKEVLMR